MTIPHFADRQNLVFLPALAAALVATVLICLPIVFAPALRRGSRARSRALIVVAGVVAAASLVVTGWQAGVGVRTLQRQREAVAAEVQARYGIGLTASDANELVDGGAPQKTLPAQAQALGLTKPTHALRFKATAIGADTYDLYFGGRLVTPTA